MELVCYSSHFLGVVHFRVAQIPGTMANKFCTVAPDTCGSSVWNFLHGHPFGA